MNLLRQQFLRHLAQTSPSPLLVEAERAEGVFFYSPDEKRYFDLVSGVSVSNVGHGNRLVVEAIKRQSERYLHLMVYGELVQRPQVDYAAGLISVMPEVMESVYFVNSGSEAIEGAMKLAKRYTARSEIISMYNAYHGSTQGALSLFGGDELKRGFEPLLPDVRHIEYNNFGDIEYVTELTAAVFVEPVQGEAGVRLPAKGYLEALRRRCDQTGTLLVFDEIQTGLGRTGNMFAMTGYGVTPDIVVLAKALGGGMPLGAFVSSSKVMSVLQTEPALGHITTFGGHPLCCAAGLAAFNYIIDERLLDDVEQKGAMFERLLEGHGAVVEIRRCGLLMAVELGEQAKLQRVVKGMLDAGIMSDWFLFCDTAFRISPPLIISDYEIQECCSVIIGVLDKELLESV